MHRALWLWANGYITKESHDNARLNRGSSIIKVWGQDGRLTKLTNFSKDQWEEFSDMHMRDVLVIRPEKLQVIEGDIRNAADMIAYQRKSVKCKRGQEANRSDKKAWGSGYQFQAVSSDSNV